MSQKDTKITVLGDGGWGTTLAILLAEKGYSVTLWGAFPKYVEEIRKKRENVKFMPGFKIPENVNLSHSLDEAISFSDTLVLVVPSQHMQSVLAKFPKQAAKTKSFVIFAKGIETSSLQTMSQVLRGALGKTRFAVVSGPNIAREVGLKMPSAASVASTDTNFAKHITQLFGTDRFQLFYSEDVLGVELGGSLKNVIAIGAGIIEGLGMGANTRALIFARGVAEMARLGVKMGAKRETFTGLSGLGDLATTCLSAHSRNRTLGHEIGKGKKLSEILGGSEMVVEGVETAKSAFALAKKYHVSMPISNAVYRVLFKKADPKVVVDALLSGGSGRESD
jgi:glycerol-3-phosphate dehydrogenase (NAD(P)+)